MNDKREIPEIQAGIFSADEITFTLNGLFMPESDSLRLSGNCKVFHDGGSIVLVSGDREIEYSDKLVLIPLDPGSSSFTLNDVIIGLNFHWQRKEDQSFSGCLKLIAGEEKISTRVLKNLL